MMQPVEKLLRANLLAAGKAYAKATKRTLATVSRKAHGDSRFFEQLAKGNGSFTARKYDEVAAFLVSDWPEGLPWPPLATLVPPPARPKE